MVVFFQDYFVRKTILIIHMIAFLKQYFSQPSFCEFLFKTILDTYPWAYLVLMGGSLLILRAIVNYFQEHILIESHFLGTDRFLVIVVTIIVSLVISVFGLQFLLKLELPIPGLVKILLFIITFLATSGFFIRKIVMNPRNLLKLM